MYKPRKMWKPKDGEVYYFPNTDDGTPKFVKLTWQGSPIQESFYRLGVVCKSADEAIEKAEVILECAGCLIEARAMGAAE